EMKNTYGVDGILIGRATIGNPWIFREIKHFFETGEHLPSPTIDERADICKEHLLACIEWKGESKAIGEMRKHYSTYFKAIPHFKPLRIELLQAKELDHILEIFEKIRKF
ncbi:MAG: tRNA-dihydrouridine synthase, partial [Bacteroidales bacterium]|nr:tRNA-dihydrouridine synthase [Bacteroidales bacterium]